MRVDRLEGRRYRAARRGRLVLGRSVRADAAAARTGGDRRTGARGRVPCRGAAVARRSVRRAPVLTSVNKSAPTMTAGALQSYFTLLNGTLSFQLLVII